MLIDYKNIKKQFEKSLNVYENNATVQKMIAETMILKLAKIRNCYEKILELGCGTGLATKIIKKNLHYNMYFANDLVEKSKTYIEKIIPDVNFIPGNATKIKPNTKMDLIISNAMFQWFENPSEAIIHFKTILNSNGILAFSTFAPDNFKEINEITGLTLEYKSKNDLELILKNIGFDIIHSENFCTVLNFKSPLELLTHMKNTGVNSLTEKTWTITKVKNFCDKYTEKYPRPKLTYSPIIIIAKRV